jgi:CelD/BcsL family acetyltransferase involved in cellulose biosynthesis
MSLDISLSTLRDPAALATEWRELEGRAEPSFFQSWTWIGTWLAVSGITPLVLRVIEDGTLLALALLIERRVRRHGILTVRQLVLHETGNPEQDGIWIEYNGLLMAKDAPSGMLARVIRYLAGAPLVQGWQELVLSGVSDEYPAAAVQAGLHVELDRRSPCYAVDLAAIRQAKGAWSDTLSANTRAQIRRARRHAEAGGAVTLRGASSVAEALAFFDRLIVLHNRHWRAKGKPGAFATGFEQAFHHRLITDGVPLGHVRLLCVMAGEKPIGYLYNFTYRGEILNYQSGFQYGSDNHDRPGLVSHAVCIEAALEDGSNVYNLLAGEGRYKRSIGQYSGDLLWCRAQRACLTLALERVARRLKQRLSVRRSHQGSLPKVRE